MEMIFLFQERNPSQQSHLLRSAFPLLLRCIRPGLVAVSKEEILFPEGILEEHPCFQNRQLRLRKKRKRKDVFFLFCLYSKVSGIVREDFFSNLVNNPVGNHSTLLKQSIRTWSKVLTCLLASTDTSEARMEFSPISFWHNPI